MTVKGRYHVFRSGSRYFLNGQFVLDAPYRKRGHASAGAWIERDVRGQVTAHDVVCFDELMTDAEVERRAASMMDPPRSISQTAPSMDAALRTA